MIAPDPLAAVRSIYRNPERVSGENCSVCTAPVDGYSRCVACNSHLRSGATLADIVAPISWAVAGSQAMKDLYAYKDLSLPVSVRNQPRDRLFNMLAESLSRHIGCFYDLGGADVVVATVPSSSGRIGAHPIEQMLTMFQGFEQTSLTWIGPAGLDRNARRLVSPEWYRLEDEREVRDRHVILLDDAWVSGGHIQSCAAALHEGGARWVSAVTLGRELVPTWPPTRRYLESNAFAQFDPDICPITGLSH